MNEHLHLSDQLKYSIDLVTHEEFFPIFERLRPEAFGKQFSFSLALAMQNTSTEAARYSGNYLYILARTTEEIVGWTFGKETEPGTFYMINSAVVNQHRRKGVYSALLSFLLSHLEKNNYQQVFSRHVVTNNAVLIPKLKKNFVITGLEIDERFGLLARLSYFFNPVQLEAIKVRSGERFPSGDLAKGFRLS